MVQFAEDFKFDIIKRWTVVPQQPVKLLICVAKGKFESPQFGARML